MQFTATIIAAFIGLVAAQSGTCFDDGDCIFPSGGHCVKASGQITGTCSSGSTTLATKASATGTAPAASATGATCYDDGDCILHGGHCVKDPTSIFGLLGHCSS